jgi:hypothetical protein
MSETNSKTENKENPIYQLSDLIMQLNYKVECLNMGLVDPMDFENTKALLRKAFYVFNLVNHNEHHHLYGRRDLEKNLSVEDDYMKRSLNLDIKMKPLKEKPEND